MARIDKIDKNLKVKTNIKKDGLVFFDINKKPFNIFGVTYDGKGYIRMDSSVAEKTNNGVKNLNRNTSGGRVAFETDSDYVAISYKGDITLFPHMPLTGTAGFDLYYFEDGEFRYFKTFVPPVDKKKGFESIVEFPDKKIRKILIHFPLYSNVDSVHIGIDEKSQLGEFNPYSDKLPVVYYGSSITQGGCASRPGNNYPAIVSQKMLDDFICLGFSGSAHGEDVIADYIASLDMSAFVLDYDHNDIGEPERLKEKQFAFYQKVRAKHKDIPIIMMTSPYSLALKPDIAITRKILGDSFARASENDNNVYFIDGREMLGEEFLDCATVDSCHPNDYGFVKMAEAVLKVFEEIK